MIIVDDDGNETKTVYMHEISCNKLAMRWFLLVYHEYSTHNLTFFVRVTVKIEVSNWA